MAQNNYDGIVKGHYIKSNKMLSPIFIIGVPRSGTTLLRVILDSHTQIAAAPETPWILGGYGSAFSLRMMICDLIEHFTSLLAFSMIN